MNKKKNKGKEPKGLLKGVLFIIRLILVIPMSLILLIVEIGKSLYRRTKKDPTYLITAIIILTLVFNLIVYVGKKITKRQEENNQKIQTIIEEMKNQIDTTQTTITDIKTELDKNKQERKNLSNQITDINRKTTSRSGEMRKEEPKKKENATTQVVNKPVVKTTKTDLNEYQRYAKDLCINQYHWSEHDFECLVKLWTRESNWRVEALNKSSGAYGIPQSLPARKMASEGTDYLTNYKTQIKWGLKYIYNRYRTPANAWKHSQQTNWY